MVIEKFNDAKFILSAVGNAAGCQDQAEHTKTDSEGNFKLSGLTQDCTYDLKVTPSGDYLISPDTIQVKLAKADAENIEFTAFKGNCLLIGSCHAEKS